MREIFLLKQIKFIVAVIFIFLFFKSLPLVFCRCFDVFLVKKIYYSVMLAVCMTFGTMVLIKSTADHILKNKLTIGQLIQNAIFLSLFFLFIIVPVYMLVAFLIGYPLMALKDHIGILYIVFPKIVYAVFDSLAYLCLSVLVFEDQKNFIMFKNRIKEMLYGKLWPCLVIGAIFTIFSSIVKKISIGHSCSVVQINFGRAVLEQIGGGLIEALCMLLFLGVYFDKTRNLAGSLIKKEHSS